MEGQPRVVMVGAGFGGLPAARALRRYGMEGITLDKERIDQYVNESLMLVTALSPVIGYDQASAIAHRAFDKQKTLRQAALESGYISAEAFDRIVVPAHMVGDPHRDLLSAYLARSPKYNGKGDIPSI